MLHFSCDACGQPVKDERFVARVEVYPAFDPDEITEADLDADNMQQVAELIEEMEANGTTYVDEAVPRQFRFDLCPACQKKFVKDPLGREFFRRVNFSNN